MKACNKISIFTVLFLMTLFGGKAIAAVGHNYDVAPGINAAWTTLDCNWCHSQSHADPALPVVVGVGLVPRYEAQYQRCFQCHNATDATTPQHASGMTAIANHADDTVDCGMCHEVHGPTADDWTSNNNNRTGGSTAENRAYVRKNMNTVYMQNLKSSATAASTNTVFQTKPNHLAFAAADPDGSATDGFPYNGVCQACHETTTYHTQAIQTADGADADHQIPNNCLQCHQHSYSDTFSSNAFQAYHPNNHFGWNQNCQRCHSNVEIDVSTNNADLEGVVSFVHNFDCGLCHVDAAAPQGGVVNLVDGANGNAKLGAGAAADNFTQADWTCNTCHISGEFHGYNTANLGPRHDIESDSTGGYDCQACHGHKWTTGTEQITAHMPGAGSATNCTANCHNGTAGNISQASGINNNTEIKKATINMDPNPNSFKCETCHKAKGDFKRHGLSDDDGTDPDSIMTVSPDSGTKYHTHLYGGSTGHTVTYSSGAIIKNVAEYNCGDCHETATGSNDDYLPSTKTKPFTSLETMQVHTWQNGTGNGNCLTCHSYANGTDDVQTQIGNYSTDNSPSTGITCETCHKAGNNPAAATDQTLMEQYEGKRHHTTAHAQAGDCTWCHADPRPDTLLSQGWAGVAETVTATGGLDPDYTMTGTTPVPGVLANQLACRECHTNDTAGSSGNTDLIVYKNTYTPTTATIPTNTNVAVTAATVQQVEQHRIKSLGGDINAYNYGSCLTCHTVNIFHAKPTWTYNTNWDRGSNATNKPFDVLRYTPGRGKFNIFESCYEGSTSNYGWQHGFICGEGQYYDGAGDPAETRVIEVVSKVHGANNSADWGRAVPHAGDKDTTSQKLNAAGTAYVSYGTNGAAYLFGQRQLIPCSASVNNAEALDLCSYQTIPYFDNLGSPPAIPDNIIFISAVWDGATVTVQARNDDGCAALSARTRPDGVQRIVPVTGFTGTSVCTGTFALGSITGVTLDIETTNAAGTNSTGNSITDNSVQPGTISFSAATYSRSEAGVTATITVTRDGGDGIVSVDYATSDGTATTAGNDYTSASGTLTWGDGDIVAQTFTVSINNDTITEADETINLTLSDGGALNGASLGIFSAVLTIVDDDLPGTLEFDQVSYSVGEGGVSKTITVSRVGGSVGTIEVDYATSDDTATLAGNDYTSSSGRLTFGDGVISQTFSVTINQDSISEGNENITLTLTSFGGSVITGNNPVSLTIVDDDNASPVLTITQPATAVSVTQGNNYAITYNLTDTENDATVITFYYSTDTTFDVGDQVACTTASVTPPQTASTCTWNTTGVTTSTAYYIYGVADDSLSAPGTDWSTPGTVTVNAPPTDVTLLGTPENAEGANNTSLTITNFTIPAGNNRIVLVVAGVENGAPNPRITGGNCNGALSEINSQADGRDDLWVGYRGLGSGGATTCNLQVNWSETSADSIVWAAVYENANQTQASDFAGCINCTGGDNNPEVTISTPAGGRVVYAVHFNGGGNNTITVPTTDTWIEHMDVDVQGGWRLGVGERNPEVNLDAALLIDPSTGTASPRTELIGVSIDPAP